MKIYLLIGCLLSTLAGQISASEPNLPAGELKHLLQEVQSMRAEYEARLKALEDRLLIAEQKAQDAEIITTDLEESVEELAFAPTANQALSRPGDFNPEIGLVMVGSVQHIDSSGGTAEIPGFVLGDETDLGEQGLSVGESDFVLSGNVDDKFYASMTLAVSKDEGVVLEEGYLQTLALGGGFNIKAGRFFSSIGYMNENHLHTDDFSGRPLPYRAMLGNQYADDGLQLSWLAPTELYWKLDAEVFRGDEFPAGGAVGGAGAWTLSSHWGGSIGDLHSWQAGVSLLHTEIDSRETGEDPIEVFTGDSELYIADFVYKWAPANNRSLKIQGEYFYREEDGLFALQDSTALTYFGDQKGWYLEAVYQPFQKWRGGIRHSQVSSDDLSFGFGGTRLDRQDHRPSQNSVMVEWSNSEFSRIRLQYNHDQSLPQSVDIWTLQYIMSIGAHSAHSY